MKVSGQYTVNKYQGNVSVRFEASSSTTVYMDTTLASFDTEEEAKEYAQEVEQEVYTSWQEQNTCPVCGYTNYNQDGWCYC